ncbi:MAG TPA: 3-deoxy-manno-octulosonate cytidylyltransferase [Vicinamibacteria bacterium]|nr:3-deoxy-manno-octulosonate cytidylyltransferase [Vicinamibacteria bacterium]
MRTIAVIPARYSSKRLPGKPLADIAGKTMVQRVYEKVVAARRVDQVLVATDDERIRDVVTGFGGRALMTSRDHRSGSDRVAEAVRETSYDLVVNVQGDEPLLDPRAIDETIELAAEHEGVIATLRREISSRDRLLDRDVVKVVVDRRGFALYFSRSPIPVPPPVSEALPPNVYYEHVGLYVYPKERLLDLAALPPTPLEELERLEQLRALENGMPIRVGETEYESMAVDTEADLEKVQKRLESTTVKM